MIEIIYTAPCTYNPREIGFGEAMIGYTGENPVATAERYVRQIHPRARLYVVVKDNHIWFQ